MMCQTPVSKESYKNDVSNSRFTERKPEEWQKQNKKIAISEEEGYNKKV